MSPRLDSWWSGSFPLPGREFHPLEAPGLAWRTEVGTEICVYDFSMASVDQLMGMSYSIQCAAVLPISVLL